ncbi:MAG TPA: penicillin-binding protein activator, partial [Xylella taiwanensis]
MNQRFVKVSMLLLATLLVAGCVTTSTQVFLPRQSAGVVLLEQGKPREAAQQLEAEASQARGSERMRLLA